MTYGISLFQIERECCDGFTFPVVVEDCTSSFFDVVVSWSEGLSDQGGEKIRKKGVRIQ